MYNAHRTRDNWHKQWHPSSNNTVSYIYGNCRSAEHKFALTVYCLDSLKIKQYSYQDYHSDVKTIPDSRNCTKRIYHRHTIIIGIVVFILEEYKLNIFGQYKLINTTQLHLQLSWTTHSDSNPISQHQENVTMAMRATRARMMADTVIRTHVGCLYLNTSLAWHDTYK